MTKELVISANRHETKVVILEDDQLVEVYFQRANEYSLAGSIHKGRVTRVLPGMQSAFVDLGLERDTFLYVSDFFEESGEDIDTTPLAEERPRQDRRPPAPVSVTATETAAAPAAESRPQRDDRGDRRGRRSRRRRGGRGFPESKYATDVGAAAVSGEVEPESAAELVPEEIPEADTGDVIVLPGESLAKYKDRSAAAGNGKDEPESSEPMEAAESAEILASAEAAASDESSIPAENGVENPYDQPAGFPSDNAIPDAPVHEIAAQPEDVAFPPEPEVPPPAELALGEPPTAQMAEPETSEAGEESDEALDAEEVEAVMDALDAGDRADEEADAEADQAQEAAEAALAAESGAPAEASEIVAGEGGEASSDGAPLTAQVRDQSARYPHRASRRMRRRGRAPGDSGRQESHSRPDRPERPEHRMAPRPERTGAPLISDLLKEGQEIIVQIAKEPLGQKGARITSHVALPGRYVVYMPTLEHMGVSRKIASDEERLRLKRILQGRKPGPVGGFITRTAAEGRTDEEIAADMDFLYNMWQEIKTKADRKPAPVLLYHDLDVVQRVLRDQLTDNFKAIWADNEEVYERVLRFVERFQPALVGKVKLYTRPEPIFDSFSITSELEKALRPKVWLKSGGYIVINQTEALVAIDVNTGKFVGKSNRLEDTIVKTNTEAIKEIVRQIRLRDLGGIIVIDFIDMDERKNRQKVMQALEEAMRADRAPYKILQFNDFGLVAITRKRVKQSLERTLCAPCPHCEGAGYIKSVTTVISEILQEARKMADTIEGKDVILRVHPDVGKVLKSHQNKYLEELEEVLRRPVMVKSDAMLHHERFDLA